MYPHPPAPPLHAASSPTRACASPLPQSQQPRAMLALLPNSPVPIAVPARGAGFGKSLQWARCSGALQLNPAAHKCCLLRRASRTGSGGAPLASPHLFFYRLSVGTRDLCVLPSKPSQTEWSQSYQGVLANRHKCKQIVQKQKSHFFRTQGKRKNPQRVQQICKKKRFSYLQGDCVSLFCYVKFGILFGHLTSPQGQ